MNDELTIEELEQVGQTSLIRLNELVTAFENGEFNKVVELGTTLLNDISLDKNQKDEIVRMIDSSKAVLAKNKEEKGSEFGL